VLLLGGDGPLEERGGLVVEAVGLETEETGARCQCGMGFDRDEGWSRGSRKKVDRRVEGFGFRMGQTC
jgi:hypothetical protein